jgi:hypothetical protein
MKILSLAVAAAALAVVSASAAGQGRGGDGSSPIDVQLAALDTAHQFWTSSKLLTDRTVVLDSRPALPSVASRTAPAQRVARPGARAAGESARLAAAVHARPATDAELNPCQTGQGCKFTPNLATVIVGDPVIQGDAATVIVGLSIVFEQRGALRARATYWSVSLVRDGHKWRPVGIKVASQG